jgi:uncharacterized protein (TIGR01777 family)
MNILIAGGTGFVGRNLIPKLINSHQVTVLSRKISDVEIAFRKQVNACDWDNLDKLNPEHFDSVINLCGRNIGQGRWTPEIKKELIDSRVNTTKQLLLWAQNTNLHFYCANAIGIYGAYEKQTGNGFTEDNPINIEQNSDFLSKIGLLWQNACNESNLDTTIMRFGVVLKKKEGMLKKLFPSFYLGMGSIIGSGQQFLSWIHINDLVKAIIFLLEHPEKKGIYNLTSPLPVKQAQFARRLAHSLNRPVLITLPNNVVKLIFGEMGDLLICKGQKVIPKRLIDEGFEFDYPTIKGALKKEFS